MHYIVLDLEWNQPMSSKSSVFNKLPIRLRGEIIEIGAVKLNADMSPGEEFQIYVKPVYFKKMHFKVKSLTGIGADKISGACGFVEAFEAFRTWCGDDCTFLTWGYDDKGIMEQNIIVHDRDWDWIAGWVNLQLIYNAQFDQGKNQKALHTAMEHFGIEQTRIAHDALGDAYNTALVCSHMDMEAGLSQYEQIVHQLTVRHEKRESGERPNMPQPLEHLFFPGFDSREDLLASQEVRAPKCPVCDETLSLSRWVSQGDQRYMTLAQCPEHGKYLVRIKIHRTEDETWSANRILYAADEDLESFYKAKAARRRHSRHRSRKRAKEQ